MNLGSCGTGIVKEGAGRVLAYATMSCLWLLAALGGYSCLLHYESKAANVAVHPEFWPDASELARLDGKHTLVMFVHPKCPCTAASLTELSILMSKCSRDLRAYAVFIRPEGTPDGWEQSDHWRRANEIPGVTVLSDREGLECRRFNADTSGETLLYSADGKLVFSGGITGARGHEGDNQGLDSVMAKVENGDMRCNETRVFGCALRNAEETQALAQGQHND